MTDQTDHERERFELDIGRIEELIGEYCGYQHANKLGTVFGTCLVGEFIYLLQLASVALYAKQDDEARALDGGAVSQDAAVDVGCHLLQMQQGNCKGPRENAAEIVAALRAPQQQSERDLALINFACERQMQAIGEARHATAQQILAAFLASRQEKKE